LRRMKGFKRLIGVSEALEKLRKAVTHRIREVEEIELMDSLGRICAEDVKAMMDIPPYDRSAVDGYAIIAEDVFGASPMNPIKLKLVDRILAGTDPSTIPRIERGEAVEIMTGAPIPSNANAVVMAEDVKAVEGGIEVMKPVHPYQNVSRRGEDFAKGEIVIRRGVRVKPWHIGALASLNVRRLKVFRRPRISVLSTGDELIELGGELKPGKMVNSTKPMLMALLLAEGCIPLDLGIVGDDVDEIHSRILTGLRKSDGVIVTGGSSIGVRDLVPEAVKRLGEIVFHGVRMRPGKPTGAAVSDGKPIFMLSGFPVAAAIGFEVFVRPILAYMQRCVIEPRPRIRGILTRRVVNPPSTRSYVRVKVFESEGKVMVEPLRLTGSGILSSLTRGNGLLIIPEELEGYDEGDSVEVELLHPISRGDER